MPSVVDRIREGAISIIGGRPYRQKQEQLVGLLEKAYRQGPALVPTQAMFEALGEVDARLLDLWARQFGYEVLNGRWVGQQYTLTEQDRLRVVDQSRWQYHMSSQYENAITMWTDFGFGQQVSISPLDDNAKALWDEAFSARRNAPLFKQRKFHEMSTQLLKDGEFFIAAYASTVDGRVTFRKFDTESCVKVIYDNEDRDVPVWYKIKVARTESNQTGYLYYPDWEASEADREQEWARILKDDGMAVRASEMSREIELNGEKTQATDAVMLHVALEVHNGRGWPKMRRFIEWDDSLRQHIGDHLTVAKAVATFVDKVRVKSGSRAVDQVAAQFQSTLASGATDWIERNPAQAAGSVFVGNEQLDLQRRPLGTAASDAQTTSGLVAGQMSVASKAPLHWMGYPQQLQNRATARETNRPFIEQMERYQQFWADIFHDMVGIVTMFAQRYNAEYASGFETDEVEVTSESPQSIPAEEVGGIMEAITGASSMGVLDAGIASRANEWLTMVALVNLGARNVLRILEPEEGQEAPETAEPEEPQVPEEEAPEPETEAQSLIRLMSEVRALDQEREYERLSSFMRDVSALLDRQQRRGEISEAAEAVRRAAEAVEAEEERVTEVHVHADIKPPDVTVGETVVNLPEQEPPKVQVNVTAEPAQAPDVTVNVEGPQVSLPEVNVPAPQVTTPVTVQPPAIQMPDVNVNVEAPEVNVSAKLQMPDTETEIETVVERDRRTGRIDKTTKTSRKKAR